MKPFPKRGMALRGPLILLGVSIGGFLVSCRSSATHDDPPALGIATPTGKTITPAAAKGAVFQQLDPHHAAAPNMRAGFAAAVSVSPDGRMLAILTSGFNLYWDPQGTLVPELSTEYVFLFDISSPHPKQLQALPLPNSYQGLAWAPSSDRLFASGGKDDTVVEFVRNGSSFIAGRTFRLGHKACLGFGADSATWLAALAQCGPETGGLAVSPDGTRLLVANLQNDSVSLIDLASGTVVELDLRPGSVDPKLRGQPGGSYPRSVVWTSAGHAYVASGRDREIISAAISAMTIRVAGRMPVRGQPTALLANRRGSRLYVAVDNTDEVAIFDTVRDTLIEAIDAAAPERLYRNGRKFGGANSNALALTPDEGTLLVSNGGQNAVAVVRLGEGARDVAVESRKTPGRSEPDADDNGPDLGHSAVIGLIPTGWYPTGVATSKDGRTWYIVNGKSETGPNSTWCEENAKGNRESGIGNRIPKPDSAPRLCIAAHKAKNTEQRSANGWPTLLAQNQYIYQLEKGGLLTLPVPEPLELARLTKQVARNNHFDQPENQAANDRLFSFLRRHIQHVIYIIKENRSYDQILGDLEIGNGDPRLAVFPEKLSPNHHAIARNFVTLDNFLVSGESSWTGWDWSVSAQANDFREREEPLAMSSFLTGGGGVQGETALNRGIHVGYATAAERKAADSLSPSNPDILPGARDIYAPDGPDGEAGKGFLWDVALRRGRTVRNWGFFDGNGPRKIPLVHDPHAEKLTVFFSENATLRPYSDPYFRAFGPDFPDFWRVQEWKREFAEFSAAGTAPNLMLVRIGNDHFGNFARAIDGVNTVDTQMADNDYALGLLLEAVANSPFAGNTLLMSIEDDAQDGPDHVDAHRSVTLIAGPYVRQHALVSTRYTTVEVVRTIEEILGLEPIGLNDALAAPMSDVFDSTTTTWSFKSIVPEVLRSTQLPLPAQRQACNAVPRRSREYWARVTAGQNFAAADRLNTPAFNRALWRGLKGDEPYPAEPTGVDLRANRAALLRQTRASYAGGCSRDESNVSDR